MANTKGVLPLAALSAAISATVQASFPVACWREVACVQVLPVFVSVRAEYKRYRSTGRNHLNVLGAHARLDGRDMPLNALVLA